MITPRILFLGDPAEAYKYAGIAKDFGRSTFAAGIISKVWKLSESVYIKVVNNLTANICKVWIEAGKLQPGYQFYCTTPIEQHAESNFSGFFIYEPYGSAVYIAIPPYWTETEDNPEPQLKPKPTGSSREESEDNLFPSSLSDVEFMNSEMFYCNGIRQAQGIAEHPYYVTSTNEEGKVTVSGILHTAWVCPDSHIPYYNAYVPVSNSVNRDLMYDLSPSYRKNGSRRVKQTASDADWYQRACIQFVNSERWGSRTFAIMESADGKFHAWPLLTPIDSDEDLRDPTFIDQAIKTNISSDFARSVQPDYPSWVHRVDNKRQSYIDRNFRETLDPRYIWSFNSTGTRAITVMLERKRVELNYGRIITTENPRREVTTTTPIKIFAESVYNPSNTTSDYVSNDRPGIVELNLNITLTGESLEDFDFSILIESEQAPTNEDTSRLISVAYAIPTQWSRFEGVIGQIKTDDIIEATIQLFEHEDSINYERAMDGVYGLELPHQSIVTIKNRTQSIEIMKLAGHLITTDNELLPVEKVYNKGRSILVSDYYSFFYYLDLGSLSFLHIIEGRIAKLGEDIVSAATFIDYYLSYERQQVQCDVYAFGQKVSSQSIGNTAVNIPEFINKTEPIENVSLLLPNKESTIRGNYLTTEQRPWWWDGRVAEGTLIREAYKDQFNRHYEEDGAVPLSSVTQSSFYADFMMPVYNGIVGERNPIGPALFSSNLSFSLTMWENDIQWLLWLIFDQARTALLTIDEPTLTEIYDCFEYSAIQHFSSTVSSNSLLDKSPYSESGNDIIIRDYPWGEFRYSEFINRMTTPFLRSQGKVIVHPQGHVSAFYKLFCAKDWIPQYNLGVLRKGNLISMYNIFLNLKDYVSINPEDVGALTSTDFDHLIVDYIHFNDGNIVTTHNDLYNIAYQHNFTLDEYRPLLQIGIAPTNDELGLLVDGYYIPLHQLMGKYGLVPQTNRGFYTLPPGISATRLSAAFL